MKKKTALDKAMDVIQCYIGRKLTEAKKLKTQEAKSKFYQCLEEKGFRVEVNKYQNEVISINYSPYTWNCMDAYKKQQAKLDKKTK